MRRLVHQRQPWPGLHLGRWQNLGDARHLPILEAVDLCQGTARVLRSDPGLRLGGLLAVAWATDSRPGCCDPGPSGYSEADGDVYRDPGAAAGPDCRLERCGTSANRRDGGPGRPGTVRGYPYPPPGAGSQMMGSTWRQHSKQRRRRYRSANRQVPGQLSLSLLPPARKSANFELADSVLPVCSSLFPCIYTDLTEECQMAPFAEFIGRLRSEIQAPAPPEARPSGKRRIRSRAERFWAFVDRSAGTLGCWLWRGSCSQSNGRPQFYDRNPATGKMTMRGASIVAWELHNERPKPPDKSILHDQGCVRLCVTPRHLRTGTPKENTQDAIAEGRLRSRKLTADQAREIVELVRGGETWPDVAERYGVGVDRIRRILQGSAWAEATGIAYTGPRKPGRPQKPKASEITFASWTARLRKGLPC